METAHSRHFKETGDHILASDLDGTLIPLPDRPQNQADLEILKGCVHDAGITLIFITGRHFELACRAIEQFRLPEPDWLICDVGTSIFQRDSQGGFCAVEAYWQHQDGIIASLPMDALRRQLESIAGLQLQEEEKQGRFKLSFYVKAAELGERVADIQQHLERAAAPYSIIHSVDPFNGDGLIDLVPANVSKAFALAWWVEHASLSRDAIVFAGDSGNDLAALTAGYRAIVVGNADRSIAEQAAEAHRRRHWKDRLYLARSHATSGVLEGCRWFGLVDPD